MFRTKKKQNTHPLGGIKSLANRKNIVFKKMKSIIFSSWLLLAETVLSESPALFQERIIGGQEVNRNLEIYAQLWIGRGNGSEFVFDCGATFYTAKVLITAAHCFLGFVYHQHLHILHHSNRILYF